MRIWKKIIFLTFITAGMFLFSMSSVMAEETADDEDPLSVEAPSAILMEASTGEILYEKNADEQRSPASITKIMTLLLIFEELEKGTLTLNEEAVTSAHAKSMGGSQVFLEEGEKQTVETLIKCIVVASGNDASVAMAEHIAGSETEFVKKMNQKAKELGLTNTVFEDCCGLSDSDGHHTTAHDVAVISRELITKHPQVLTYSSIWMEDITHTTEKGTSRFGLTNTNKLVRGYDGCVGLKTGSTSKAKFCVSAVAVRDEVTLISVIMGAQDSKSRFRDASSLLNYGFGICRFYVDENKETLPPVPVTDSIKGEAACRFAGEFRYLDTKGADLSGIKKELVWQDGLKAPIKKGDTAGYAVYRLDGKEIGRTAVLFAEDVEKSGYADYIRMAFLLFLGAGREKGDGSDSGTVSFFTLFRKKVFVRAVKIRYNKNNSGRASAVEQFNKKQIIELLNSKIQIWRFPRLLKELDGDADTLQVRLTKKLSSYELQGSENREQTARKIRNWLAGKNQPANREELFRICFALGFDREKTETLFLSADENSIHYRNPRELIYAFCLEKGYSYPLALELVQELGEENMSGSRLENQAKIRKTSDTDSTQTMTASIRDEFKRLDTLDDLKQFIQKNRETFGYHHNTAYRKFKVMLSYLLTGKSDHESYSNIPREKRYSIERATEEYLRMGLPYQKKSGHYSKVEKIIKRHWPSPKMVQEMYSRKRDVNRKTLLLLYLATEGMGVSEPSETSFVQEHCQRIDLMLTSCGMPLLNPHNPFDYLVMQSLHLENDDDFMSWKMERLLKKLFREPYQPSYVTVDENENENGR